MPSAPEKRENLFLNLVFNLAVPFAALSYLSKPERLGPVWALVVAVAFPIAYGVWDFISRRKTNFVSILGLTSVVASGGLGLLQADGIWFAVKSGIVPVLIGVAVLLSSKSKRPLVREMLYNDQVIDVARVDAVLAERGNRAEFEGLLRRASHLLVLTFLVSGLLNFLVARWVIKSPSGTEAFNAEYARLHLLDFVFATVPSMAMMMFALFRLFEGIKRLTGLTTDEILRAQEDKAATPAA